MKKRSILIKAVYYLFFQEQMGEHDDKELPAPLWLLRLQLWELQELQLTDKVDWQHECNVLGGVAGHCISFYLQASCY